MVDPRRHPLRLRLKPGLLEVIREGRATQTRIEARAECVRGRRSSERRGLALHAREHWLDRPQADGKPELTKGQTALERTHEFVAGDKEVKTSIRIGEKRVQDCVVGDIAVGGEVEEFRGGDEEPAHAERIRGSPCGFGARTHAAHRADLAADVRRHWIQAMFGCADARESCESVERIMLTHRRDQRTGEVDAHLPVQPHGSAGAWLVDERGGRNPRELDGVAVPNRIAGGEGKLRKRTHPSGEIVKVLPVAIPFKTLIERLANRALRKRLADAQSPRHGVALAIRIGKTADPARARIARAVTAEIVVDEISELDRIVEVLLALRRAVETEQREHRVGVGPEIATRWIGGAVHARTSGEGTHEELRGLNGLAAHAVPFCKGRSMA